MSVCARKSWKKKHDGCWKPVNNIYTGNESWIFGYMPETKQSTNEAFDSFKNHVLEIPDSEKTASKIGSNAWKIILIFMDNIFKKYNYDHNYSFFYIIVSEI